MKCRSLAQALHLDRCSVLVKNTVRDRKAQARTRALGGKERIEDPGHIVRLNSTPSNQTPVEYV